MIPLHDWQCKGMSKYSKYLQKYQETITYVIIWLCVAFLPVIIEVWENINGNTFEWRHVVRWWMGMVPLIVLFLINNYLLMPRLLKKAKVASYLSAVGVMLVAFVIYQHSTMPEFIKSPDRFVPPMELRQDFPPPDMVPDRMRQPAPPMRLPLPELFMLVLGMMTVGINVAVSLVFEGHGTRLQNKELENFKLQEELKYLKYQISPHFLMNVLNNIHEMAEEDTRKAQKMIIELSQLMRHALYEDGTASLAAEVTFISSYISLMKMRYPDETVKVTASLPENPSRNKKLPTLLLISFIENAFKHGVTYMTPTYIDITLNETENHLYFSCVNTVSSMSDKEKEGGVGIVNVRRRLDLLYGDDYPLSINEDDNTYSVTLIIPCTV